MYPKFQKVIPWVLFCKILGVRGVWLVGWLLLCFLLVVLFFLLICVCGGNNNKQTYEHTPPTLTWFQCSVGRWPSFLANMYLVRALAFLLYSVCVNSVFCGQVNCFAVLDWIPMCLLKLFLQICWEWSCKPVGLCKLRGWFCSSQGAWVLTAYPVPLLFSTIVFSFLLGSMPAWLGSEEVLLCSYQGFVGAEEGCKDSRGTLNCHGYPHWFGAVLHDVPTWNHWGE